jgi:hypothetical protein
MYYSSVNTSLQVYMYICLVKCMYHTLAKEFLYTLFSVFAPQGADPLPFL